jgi:hypothetical protein
MDSRRELVVFLVRIVENLLEEPEKRVELIYAKNAFMKVLKEMRLLMARVGIDEDY